MRQSHLFTKTKKEAPKDEVSRNAQLLIRAGYVYKVMAGVYAYTPLGLRVLENIKRIVREEMNRAGAQEVLMPVVQPADLWQESGRWEQYGPELLRIEDRHQRPFCLGPTHEEIITDLMRNVTRLETVSWASVPRWVSKPQNIGSATTSFSSRYRNGE